VPEVPPDVCGATRTSPVKPHFPASPSGFAQGLPTSDALKICTRLLPRSHTYSWPSFASLAQWTGLRKNFGFRLPALKSSGHEPASSPAFSPRSVFADHRILTPTVADPPLPLGSFNSQPGNPLYGLQRAAAFVPFTPICNVTGQPAMSVPLFWNADGLPIGTHFVGRFGDEATLFRLAAQLEAARPWTSRRPQVH
jgi:Amidase